MEKTQFHKDIDAIVQQAISEDEEMVRVCGSCEEEVGPQKIGPGQAKSHSYCKRHYLQMMKDEGNFPPEMVARYQARPEESFAPDLRQHPELVDSSVSREDFIRQKRAFFGTRA